MRVHPDDLCRLDMPCSFVGEEEMSMRLITDARYAWLQAKAEREVLRGYGPTYPLRDYLDRLQLLDHDDGRDRFCVELTPREFAEWIAHHYHDVDTNRALLKAALRRTSSRRVPEALVSDVLVFVAHQPVTYPTTEPA